MGGDFGKDDPGDNAVFGERGASASHMTAASLAVLDKQVVP